MKLVDLRLDAWQPLPGDGLEPLPGVPPVPSTPPTPQSHRLLSLAQWQALQARWPVGFAVGVWLANDADPMVLKADLPRLALVALQFPKWTDGRAYSQAHLLRARLGYAGELRATGQVVADMLPLLWRTGFDAAVLRADQRLEVARRALDFFAAHYQGDLRTPGRLSAAA